MRAPVRPLSGRWPARLESSRASRFFWRDPRVVLDPTISADEFRTAMSAFHVGSTIKITGANRHPNADDLLINNVDLTNAHVVDIGVSDGSTAVDLIQKLPAFASYTMADLFFHISAGSDAATHGRAEFERGWSPPDR